jgi:cellulose biosynthesis protein BcsQ
MGQILNFLSEVFRRGADEFAAGLVGLGVAFLYWFFCWRPGYRRRNRELRDQRDRAEAAARRAEETAAELSAQLDHEKGESNDLGGQVMEREQVIDALRTRVDTLRDEIKRITEVDGEVWQRAPAATVPAFVPLKSGRPPIIAVVNLKGGVGKTTIAANLGAAAFSRDRRVLFVDLDFQGSLTSLCLSAERIFDAQVRERFVQKLLSTPNPSGRLALELTERIEDKPAWVLPTHESLASAEMQTMFRWMAGGSADDVRYRLRRALHSDEVAANFDLVLLDCPPRLSTACINALAACDYVLIPVILDQLSAEAAPRMLRWLRKLKYEDRVCPDFTVLGMVADKVQNVNGPSTRQQDVWDSLAVQSTDAWQEPVYRFQTTIPEWTEFAQAASSNTFAALNGKAKPRFFDLLDELTQRMPAHESRRAAVVSS